MVFDYTETTMTIREQLTVNFECPLLTLKEQASEIKYLSISSSNMLTFENFGLPKTKISCTSATIQTRKFKLTFLQTNISRKLIFFKPVYKVPLCRWRFFFLECFRRWLFKNFKNIGSVTVYLGCEDPLYLGHFLIHELLQLTLGCVRLSLTGLNKYWQSLFI